MQHTKLLRKKLLPSETMLLKKNLLTNETMLSTPPIMGEVHLHLPVLIKMDCPPTKKFCAPPGMFLASFLIGYKN